MIKKYINFFSLLALLSTANIFAQEVKKDTDTIVDLYELSLEDLLDMEITSVSKKVERLQDVSSSIYVITSEDILRSGATTLHEALRTIPGYWGIQTEYSSVNTVIRSSPAENAVAGGLLFLLDGTPIQNLMTSTFSFENFDIPLDEIERIEVIRGSAGALYGANSATGVINIFTKDPDKYDGINIRAEAASPSYANITLRAGGKINDKLSISGYGKMRLFGGYGTLPELDGDMVTVPNSLTGTDTTINNRFIENFEQINTYSMGFKTAYQMGENTRISFNSHFNIATQNEYTNFDTDMALLGAPDSLVFNEITRNRIVGNLRFDHRFNDNHNLFFRTSTNIEDNFKKTQGGYFLKNSIVDFEIQDNLSLGEMNDLIFGMNHRIVNFNIYEINDEFGSAYINPKSTEQLNGFFIQDKIKFLGGKLNLIIGAKAENYSIIGNKYYFSPMAKLSIIPYENFTFWGGITRSYTTPGYDFTNVDKLFIKTLSDEVVAGIATQEVYEGVYAAAFDGAIAVGADEETAAANATAQANSFLASDAGQASIADAILQTRASLPNNVGVLNSASIEPTEFLTYEAGFRTSIEKSLFLESNFFYSNVSDGLIVTSNVHYMESPTRPGTYVDYYLYGNYLKGINYGLESMVRIIPSEEIQLEFSHVFTAAKWELQENDDFDIYDLDINLEGIDRTSDVPQIPKHVLRLKASFSLPKNIRMDFGLIYATKFSSNEAQYNFVTQRHPNVLSPEGTLIAENKERTIVNIRIEKSFMNRQLKVYTFGQDIFNDGIIANTNILDNVTLTQISGMYGAGVLYNF